MDELRARFRRRQRHLPDDRQPDPDNPRHSKFVIAAGPGRPRPPFIAAVLPQFVETRGGDYFFIPSITALRMIAMGSVDPT